MLPELLNPLSLGNRLDCHVPELGYQIKILRWPRYDLEARGGFGDAAPEPTGDRNHLPRRSSSYSCRGVLGVGAEMAATVQAWQ